MELANNTIIQKKGLSKPEERPALQKHPKTPKPQNPKTP